LVSTKKKQNKNFNNSNNKNNSKGLGGERFDELVLYNFMNRDDRFGGGGLQLRDMRKEGEMGTGKGW